MKENNSLVALLFSELGLINGSASQGNSTIEDFKDDDVTDND